MGEGWCRSGCPEQGRDGGYKETGEELSLG